MKRMMIGVVAAGAFLAAGAIAGPDVSLHALAAPARITPANNGCLPKHLKVSAVLNASGSTSSGYVSFTNTGTQACLLAGWPIVLVQDRAGHEVKVGVHLLSPKKAKAKTSVMLTAKGVKPAVRAYAKLTWSNWCGKSTPAALRVTVARSKHYMVVHPSSSGAWVPSCASASKESAMSISTYKSSAPKM